MATPIPRVEESPGGAVGATLPPESPRPAPICAGKPYPHAAAVCDDRRHICAHGGRTFSLTDVAQLISEWPSVAQCHVLAFALALPATLVSDYWRVLWIADAAAHDTDREEDLLCALRGQIAAREVPAEPSSAA